MHVLRCPKCESKEIIEISRGVCKCRDCGFMDFDGKFIIKTLKYNRCKEYNEEK